MIDTVRAPQIIEPTGGPRPIDPAAHATSAPPLPTSSMPGLRPAPGDRLPQPPTIDVPLTEELDADSGPYYPDWSDPAWGRVRVSIERYARTVMGIEQEIRDQADNTVRLYDLVEQLRQHEAAITEMALGHGVTVGLREPFAGGGSWYHFEQPFVDENGNAGNTRPGQGQTGGQEDSNPVRRPSGGNAASPHQKGDEGHGGRDDAPDNGPDSGGQNSPAGNQPEHGGRPDSSDGGGSGDGGGSSDEGNTGDECEGGTDHQEPRSQRDPWGYVEDGVEVEVEQCRDNGNGLPPSLEEGGGPSGNDVGGGRWPQRTPGVTPRDVDFVGPFVTTTEGVDDKDQPDMGDRPEGGTSNDDDLGNDLPGDRTVGPGGEPANPFRELFFKMLGIDPGIVY